LIKLIKSCLRKVVGNSSLNYDKILTILVEIENIMNERPLTYLSDENVDESITPAHLLYGRSLHQNNQRSIIQNNDDDNPETYRNRRLYTEKLIQQIWNRFVNEYTISLREHHFYNKGNSNSVNVLRIDDVVIIKDDKMVSRNLWRKERVKQLIVGIDNAVRGAEIDVLAKNNTLSTIRRPLQNLIPLEVTTTNENIEDITDPSTIEVSDNNTSQPVRQRRNAAVTGELIRRMVENEEME